MMSLAPAGAVFIFQAVVYIRKNDVVSMVYNPFVSWRFLGSDLVISLRCLIVL